MGISVRMCLNTYDFLHASANVELKYTSKHNN
jgi:hypothetical protein